MKFITVARALTLLGLATVAPAANLVQNGSFESTSLTTSGQMSTTNVSNWSTISYSFLVFPGTSTSGIGGGVALYAPAGKSYIPASPDGKNFVAADGDYFNSPITQTINGLTAGSSYALTFFQASAQQQGFDGSYADNFSVSLGAQTILSNVMNTPSHGYTDWQLQTLIFNATSSTEVLSFTAIGNAIGAGGPGGGPPFTLLDGVSLTKTPEPANIWMMGGAMLALSAAIRKLRAARKA